MAIRLQNSRWVLDRGNDFPQWCAWRYWLKQNVDREFFPDKLCVWSEWPPTAHDAAQGVVDTIAATRALPDVQSQTAVVDSAIPWVHYDLAEIDDMRRKHASDFDWNPPLPEFAGHPKRRESRLSQEQQELSDKGAYLAENMPKIERGEEFMAYKKRVDAWKAETGRARP